MRLLMMGTGDFAVPTFSALLASEHEVTALATRPARPVHGRHRGPANPMKQVAQEHGLPVMAPESINSRQARDALGAFEPELFVVCDYGQILSPDTLGVAPLGGINLHGSLLPKYRGAAPVNWALYEGETETGITVIHMTPKLDGGPCLTQRRLAIDEDETAVELHHRLAELGVDAVLEAIQTLSGWDRQEVLGVRQDTSQATRAPRLQKSDGLIDWTRTAVQIRNQVRAMQPWPKTFTNWLRSDAEPLRLLVHQVAVLEATTSDVAAGTVAGSDDGRLVVSTGDGWLALESIQPSGKRAMVASEFLRGYPVRVGDQFA